jgi:hypothetical protein
VNDVSGKIFLCQYVAQNGSQSINRSKNVRCPSTCAAVMLISSGRNETYEVLFTSVMGSLSLPVNVCLQHYADGPLLWIQCSQFTPTNKNQVNVLRQDQSGWHCTETTAYCLKGAQVDIVSYIQQCMHLSLHEACHSRNPISFFFKATGPYTNVRDCHCPYLHKANLSRS